MKFFFTTFLFCSLVTFGQVPSYIPMNGLHGWWPFCGNANDDSGNGINGTVNGPVLTTDRHGSFNSAYFFDGINDYIVVNNPGILGKRPRTLSFWAKTSNSTDEIAAVGWGPDQQGSARGSRFSAVFNVFQAGVTIDAADCAITYSASAFSNNNWHHYVYQMDTAALLSQVRIYFDGNLLTNIAFPFNQSTSINTIDGTFTYFGKIDYVFDYFFDGSIDDIAIWNRALSLQEIQNLYNGSSACNLSSIAEYGDKNIFFELYPNPANERLIINIKDEFVNSNDDVEVKIYTIDGKCIGNEKLNLIKSNFSEINISNLQSGIYFVELIVKNLTSTQKFIKN